MSAFKKFANDNCNLVKECNDNKDSFLSQLTKNYNNKEEILLRCLVNRLYYALYNRIIEEMPHIKNSTAGNKHQKILDELKKHNNQVVNFTKATFESLKDLRVWADYNPELPGPGNNLNALIYKIDKIIKYKKIIP